MPILLTPAHSVPKMPASIILSMTIAAERALFVIALSSGEDLPARRSIKHHCEV
jgi:hypothetical protein